MTDQCDYLSIIIAVIQCDCVASLFVAILAPYSILELICLGVSWGG